MYHVAWNVVANIVNNKSTQALYFATVIAYLAPLFTKKKELLLVKIMCFEDILQIFPFSYLTYLLSCIKLILKWYLTSNSRINGLQAISYLFCKAV